jgi:hypothetical protein
MHAAQIQFQKSACWLIYHNELQTHLTAAGRGRFFSTTRARGALARVPVVPHQLLWYDSHNDTQAARRLRCFFPVFALKWMQG